MKQLENWQVCRDDQFIILGKHTKNYGQIHHFWWENPLFLWPFPIATLNYQRVSFLELFLFCLETPVPSGTQPGAQHQNHDYKEQSTERYCVVCNQLPFFQKSFTSYNQQFLISSNQLEVWGRLSTFRRLSPGQQPIFSSQALQFLFAVSTAILSLYTILIYTIYIIYIHYDIYIYIDIYVYIYML